MTPPDAHTADHGRAGLSEDERAMLIEAVYGPRDDVPNTPDEAVDALGPAVEAILAARMADAHAKFVVQMSKAMAHTEAETLERAAEEWEQEDTDYVGDWLRERAAQVTPDARSGWCREVDLREQIAGEIESLPGHVWWGLVARQGWQEGINEAARIARGEQP